MFKIIVFHHILVTTHNTVLHHILLFAIYVFVFDLCNSLATTELKEYCKFWSLLGRLGAFRFRCQECWFWQMKRSRRWLQKDIPCRRDGRSASLMKRIWRKCNAKSRIRYKLACSVELWITGYICHFGVTVVLVAWWHNGLHVWSRGCGFDSRLSWYRVVKSYLDGCLWTGRPFWYISDPQGQLNLQVFQVPMLVEYPLAFLSLKNTVDRAHDPVWQLMICSFQDRLPLTNSYKQLSLLTHIVQCRVYVRINRS